MKIIKMALIMVSALVLVACKSTHLRDINLIGAKNIRVLTLNEIKVKSGDPYTFSSWKCKDYFEGGKLIIEVGIIDGISDDVTTSNVDDELNILNAGFILVNGKDSGFFAEYQMDGINHRWDWEGSTGNDYAITISQDGTGHYYEFGTASLIEMFTGRTAESKQVFKCSE
jgi:hypothetical protein